MKKRLALDKVFPPVKKLERGRKFRITSDDERIILLARSREGSKWRMKLDSILSIIIEIKNIESCICSLIIERIKR